LDTIARKTVLAPLAAAAVLASSPASAEPVVVDAGAVVEIDNALLLENTQDLEFGKIAVTGAGGTVTIAPATDAASSVGGVTLYGPLRHRAEFVSRAPVGMVALISLDPSVTLTRVSGTETMTATLSRANGPGMANALFAGLPIAVKATAAEQFIYVGGSLTVAGGQAEGAYTGQFDLMLSYL
jgi:hypothetical protein